jgi:hypothetical protein
MVSFSKFSDQNAILDGIKQQEKMWPPPIAFHPKSEKTKGKTTKSEHDSDDDTDTKKKYLKVNILFDPDEPEGDSYEEKVFKFEDGDPEDFVRHRQQLDELFKKLLIEDNPDQQHRHYQASFFGKAKEEYTRAYNEHNTANEARPNNERLDDDVVLANIVNDVARKFFDNWQSSVRQQKNYLRTCLYIGNQNPKKFIERIKKINEYLPYFPYHNGGEPYAKMAEDELLDILDSAKKIDWHLTMMSQGKRPDTFRDIGQAEEYYMQLHNADLLLKKLKPASGSSTQKGKKNSDKQKSKKRKGRDGPCEHCGKHHPGAGDKCWSLSKNKRMRPNGYKPQGRGNDYDQKRFSAKETANMLTKVYASMQKKKNKKSKKRKVTYEDDEVDATFMAHLKDAAEQDPDEGHTSSDDNDSSDSESTGSVSSNSSN